LRGVIVIDSDNPLVRQNECFDPKYEYYGFGSSINVRLAREAAKRDLGIMTADVYLQSEQRQDKAICLTEMVSRLTDRLLESDIRPSICYSLESPLIARKYYHRLAKYAGRYHHNFQFRGTGERLENTGTVFHPVTFPMESRKPLALKEWEGRDYLIMVNSNKRATFTRWDSMLNIAHSAISHLYFLVLKATDPWMRIPEIYVDRIEAMKYFSAFTDFSLYGYGWENPVQGFGKTYQQAALRSYRGVISSDIRDKREKMSGFKFSLCFENCIFPGYITEKIFDCFLAGCIPVYFGAPDITDFVPAGSFIDFRQFPDFGELDKFLRGMTWSDAKGYLDTAHDFLAGSSFDRFTVDHFVNDLITVIEQEIND
jgi:hypothetical protein